METMFHTLHQFMLSTKSVVYLLMGGTLVGLLGFWFFLTGRDED
ncbi:sulfate respiration complex protein HmcD [Desulfohalobium retbaense]|uniref:Hmc operon protein 4 n=1 Tax=Desulfohalobium retbaense (strain ATCC 49708 / DSM 5692 / JCM 16813 / HR100) TaxID=485915 RepID=C8X168_DESRD|nr:hypothetical protein [Desulfohalobium retbaense]ACV68165.1 hmc operon protein 4 [Desulfohalobium retbaense DSM 5692]